MLPNPIFEFFGKGVYMYGICIALGLIACITVFYIYTGKKGMPSKLQDFILVVVIAAIAIGFLFAKLYQAVYDWIETGRFDFYGAGMTVMGGLIGGASVFLILYFLVGKYYFRGKDKDIHKKHFNTLFKVAPISICIAHSLGRVGCLMSGCCHGAYLGTEYVFGGIWMHAPDTGITGYHVPTQLYEAIFLLVLFAVLSICYFKNVNILMQIYLIAYGAWRIFIEFFRTDARGAIVLGLAPSQWQSFLFIAGGVALIIFYIIKKIPLLEKPKEQLSCDNNLEEKTNDN